MTAPAAGRAYGKTQLLAEQLVEIYRKNPAAVVVAPVAVFDLLAKMHPDLVPKPAPGQRCPRCHRTTPPARCAVCAPEEK